MHLSRRRLIILFYLNQISVVLLHNFYPPCVPFPDKVNVHAYKRIRLIIRLRNAAALYFLARTAAYQAAEYRVFRGRISKSLINHRPPHNRAFHAECTYDTAGRSLWIACRLSYVIAYSFIAY